MDRYIDVLCSCPLFKGKGKEEIKDILSLTTYKIKHYQKNDFIFRADQSPKYIGIILEGSIEIQNNLESGKFFNLLYKKKGEAFGGSLIFSDISMCKFDIVAKTSCDILLIYKESVLEILFKDSVIAHNMLSLFAKSILVLNKKIELFSHSSIQQKIAYSLLYNIKLNNNNIIKLPYSKKDWAEHLNVSRSSLSRELKKLNDKGVIEVHNKTIKIVQVDYLESILGNI
ncbi:MAG: Crp/Fnr family transcriptional regulator [Clostridia bacterium]|nr:Crp/Fnr family transcriptional regulator [Clostridia bacterium]